MKSSSSKQHPTIPKGQRTDATLQSTSSSEGNISVSEYITDGRIFLTNKVIENYLGDTMTTVFPTMIKTLIKLKAEHEGTEKAEELEQYGQDQFMALLNEATAFCNDDKSATMKDNLAKALLAKGEKGRYPHLVACFNSVLVQQHMKTIGALENPTEDQDFLFAINNHIGIVSEPLFNGAPNATRQKPDIITLLTKDIAWLTEKQNSYEGWAKFVANELNKPGELDTPNESDGSDEEGLGKSEKGELEPKAADEEGFSDLRGEASKEKATRKVAWSHISTCFKIKAKHSIDIREKLDKAYELDKMFPTDSPSSRKEETYLGGENQSASSVHTSKKRKGEKMGPNTLKKQKRDNDGSGVRAYRNPFIVSPEVQCGYYATELLRSFPDRTHSIVLLLTDNMLALHFYDAQGCIATEQVDIVTHLPLLVAMLMCFQRLGSFMFGRAHYSLKANIEGWETEIQLDIPLCTQTRWELRGRRPITCVPVPAGFADVEVPGVHRYIQSPTVGQMTRAASAQVDAGTQTVSQTICEGTSNRPPRQASSRCYDQLPPETKALFNALESYYFKLSWRETSRDTEEHIIRTARTRADLYLKERAPFVTNHLPEIIGHGEFSVFSTGHVRQHAGLEFENGKARIPTWILVKKLAKMDELLPKDFGKRYWEIIRCHFLLWKIGVAHGDISFRNLMLTLDKTRAILIDFDLAALMKPGDESPTKKGFERTGTKPFMAMELLSFNDGQIKRRYQHDLESLVWTMTWYCKEEISWTEGSLSDVRHAKMDWYFNQRSLADGLLPLPEDVRTGTRELWQKIISIHLGSNFYAKMSDLEFLSLIERHIPHDFECSWDWRKFSVGDKDSLPASSS